MSTLNVTSIQNPAAPQANLSLNADGTVTLPVYTAGVAPALFQAGTLWFDTAAPTLLVRNPGNTAWVSAGGGGGGSVTAVTGTLPITVATGTSTPVIAINAATNAAAGSIEIATLAEAATGTDATRASTPETSVPKNAAGMTGAALIPGGNNAARPGTPVKGMTRYNDDDGDPAYMEFYNGTSWSPIATLTTSAPVSVVGQTFVDLVVPAGLSQITIVFGDIATTSGTDVLVQVGPTGGVVTTGYISTSSAVSASVSTTGSTAGFVTYGSTSQANVTMTLTYAGGNIWVEGHYGQITFNGVFGGGSSPVLTGSLTKIKITTVTGTDTFTTGNVSILY